MDNKRKIYVASSWRNELQPEVVLYLRELGHEVYDFRNPAPGNRGFTWFEVDPNWTSWNRRECREGLEHPIASAAYALDLRAMEWADTFVLVLPCGRSAHLELGWAIGSEVPSAILVLDDDQEPELMAKLADAILIDRAELNTWLASLGEA